MAAADIQAASDQARMATEARIATADLEAGNLKGVSQGTSICPVLQSEALNKEASLCSAILLVYRLSFNKCFDGAALTFYLMLAADIGIVPLIYEQTLYVGRTQIDLATYAVETQVLPDARLDTSNLWFFYIAPIAIFVGYFLQAWYLTASSPAHL